MDPALISLKHDLLLDLLKSWPIIIFFIGVVFQAGGTVYMIKDHGDKLKSLKIKSEEIESSINLRDKEVSKDIAKRLYDDHSQPLFTPITACSNHRMDCERQRTKEMNYLATQMREQTKMHKEQIERLDSFIHIIMDYIKKGNNNNIT